MTPRVAVCWDVDGTLLHGGPIGVEVLGAGGLLLWRRMALDWPDRLAPRLIVAVLYALEVKGAAFTVNGMETGFLLLFLAGNVSLLAREAPRRWLGLGICWAGLMWTRPDGCISIAALTIADLAFGEGPRRRRLADALKAGLVCTALYLP